MKFSLGDVLEFVMAGTFIAAGAIKGGAFVALLVAGVCLFYLAQSHAATPVPWPKKFVRYIKLMYSRQVFKETVARQEREKSKAVRLTG